MILRLLLALCLCLGVVGPAEAAYGLVANTSVAGANGGTTAAVDTSGATLLIAVVSRFGAASISDSKANTWTGLTEKNNGVEVATRIYYAKNPTVGAGHTFTLSGASSFSAAQFAAFSGADTTAPFDVENGNINTGAQSSIQPGSLTPSQANSLVIAGVGVSGSGTGYTINSSFLTTNTNNWVGSTNEGGGLAYLIQGAAAAVNPTWSFSVSASNGAAAVIASFKPGAAAAACVPTRALMGVGC